MIPLVDLKKQYHTIKKPVQKAINAVLERGDFILGSDLTLFENEFAGFCQAQYAVGTDSGTGALELALHAAGIKQNDEVIVPVFTFYATASAVASTGATPVFCDSDPNTANIDPQKIETLITPKTKAIMPVHLFGQPCDIEPILAIAKKHKLLLIEDSAQAHGALLHFKNGKTMKTGSIGDMACFSFYPGKNLGAYGDGGMILTNNKEFADRARLLRDYGRTGKYEHSLLGFNRRLDTLQAAILRVKLKKLSSWNKKRVANGKLYDKLLKELGIFTFTILPFAETVRHVYALRIKNRDRLAEYLKEKGVATGVHYPIPLHLQKAFAYLNYQSGDFPVAESISQEILSLPIFPELTSAQIKSIVKHIKEFVAKNG